MLGSTLAQVWAYSPRYRRPRHFHAEPELNIIVHGSARFGVGNRCLEVRAGEVLGFPPGQDHVMLRGSSDLVLLAVGANEALARDASGSAGSFGLHMRPSGADFDALVARAARVAGCEDQARAAELWQTASALSLRCRTPSTHVLTRRAFTLLANDPELGRGTLAKYAQCHPTELSRHFHRDVGITLVRYRTRLRLLSLMRTMDTGANNLVRAALSAGFGSYSQCHRAFVAELGCSPSAFFSGDLRRGMESRFEPA